MKIEKSLNPNCSEAVFRFYTLEPKKIQAILQAIADEIDANTDFDGHKNQKVPLFKTAKKYDSNYGGKPSYSFQYEHVRNGDGIGAIKENMTREASIKKAYPKGALLKACAGLGDNEAVITIEKEKGAFRLNIGNNDIYDNETDWQGKVRGMGVETHYAGEKGKEGKELDKHARDCCCGITYDF